MDFKRSLLGHAERFAQIQEQLDAGHNVVILANHQTEADPAVWALLLEAAFPRLAADVIYVAGDRVVMDPLVAPFSKGQAIGTLKVMDGEQAVAEVPLVALDAVQQAGVMGRAWDAMRLWIK